MKLVPTRLPAGAICLVAVTAALPMTAAATASAGPLTPSPRTAQTIGMDYSGFSCPRQPIAAMPDVDTTLALTTQTNCGAATLVVPSLTITVPLPFTLGTVLQYVHLGRLRTGAIPYRIDAPPASGSYGGACYGVVRVGLSSVTA
jgi:hypothetical protein